MKLFKNILTITFLLCLIFPLVAETQEISAADRGFAAEEFRRGVQAYYRGAYSESVMLFEKALSYLPEESLILDWLGKACYKDGKTTAALQQWDLAKEKGYGGLLLQNRIDVIQNRRITGDSFEDFQRYVEAGSILGAKDDTLFFSQPISLLANNDGSYWVCAYGSNELLKIDGNGLIETRVRGPLVGFDRPFALHRNAQGGIILSEYAADKLTILDENGNFLFSFGEKGRKPGQLLGPQYLAQDSKNNIFVTDFGNKRISVFDDTGKFLYTISKTKNFSGFKAPGGIAIIDNRLYVADIITGAIYTFDTVGNYIDILVPEKTLQNPESLSVWNNFLLVADQTKVKLIDTLTGSIKEIASIGNIPGKLTAAVVDANENIVATDIAHNEIYVLTKMSELVQGYFIEIDKVNAEKFPHVVMDISVSNRNGTPVVGLKENNFYITEEKFPVTNLKFEGSGNNNTKADIVLVIDQNASDSQFAEGINAAVQEIAKSMKGQGTLTLISAGNLPVIEYQGNPIGCEKFSVTKLKNTSEKNKSLDIALRLAGNTLLKGGEEKKAIVFITTGITNETAFSRYSLQDVTSFLKYNRIGFQIINLDKTSNDSSLSYLTTKLSGKSWYVFRPEGLKDVYKTIIEKKLGTYRLSFDSVLPTNFGRAYLPLETEIYVLNRSGREETGYFAPLE